jgi:hypothetical protein
MAFIKGFEKKAAKSQGLSPTTLEHAGLGLLYPAAALHTYKAIKEKNKGEAATGAAELGGLGLLSRAVAKGHK